jgi:2-polyprenyl-3-methyl-5-hydroxy-6-metoxy-1,4-benzoquinol methylase
MTALDHCVACGAAGSDVIGERGAARSNVRAFRDESFAVWRCRRCASIHARDEVDLQHYYRQYPFHGMTIDWRLRALYDQQLARLERAGVRREHRILDYGCGGGAFVQHLRERGFTGAVGYDQYSAEFGDTALLEDRYECVVSQDVLEHAPDPQALLSEYGRLATPGGIVAIGTPNAAAIDLQRTAEYVHTLHVPFHRHIFSKQALLAAGGARGWRLEHYYRTQYANTAIPFLNSRFYLYYMQVCDGSLDSLLEPPKLLPLLLRLPITMFWGFFGQFFVEETDVMAIFRRFGRV